MMFVFCAYAAEVQHMITAIKNVFIWLPLSNKNNESNDLVEEDEEWEITGSEKEQEQKKMKMSKLVDTLEKMDEEIIKMKEELAKLKKR